MRFDPKNNFYLYLLEDVSADYYIDYTNYAGNIYKHSKGGKVGIRPITPVINLSDYSEINYLSIYNPNITDITVVIKIGDTIIQQTVITPKSTLIYNGLSFNIGLKQEQVKTPIGLFVDNSNNPLIGFVDPNDNTKFIYIDANTEIEYTGPVNFPANNQTLISTHIFTQPVPALIWTFNHNLGYYPVINVTDEIGDPLIGFTRIDLSVNIITLTFGIAVEGQIIAI